jgi:hypothetical protein
MKGNHTVTGGKYGERKRKHDGTSYVEPTTKDRVSGLTRVQEAIKLVNHRHLEVEQVARNVPEKKEMWDGLKQKIAKKENQFGHARVKVKVENFQNHYSKNKLPNKLQRERGIGRTALVLGKTPFGKLRKDCDMEAIKTELRYRGLSTEGGWRDDLLKRLKDNEGDATHFIARSPDVSFLDIWLED